MPAGYQAGKTGASTGSAIWASEEGDPLPAHTDFSSPLHFLLFPGGNPILPSTWAPNSFIILENLEKCSNVHTGKWKSTQSPITRKGHCCCLITFPLQCKLFCRVENTQSVIFRLYLAFLSCLAHVINIFPCHEKFFIR